MGFLQDNYIVETRKSSLTAMAEKRRMERKLQNKKVWKDGVNQRADKKLIEVCDVFDKVIEGDVRRESYDLLEHKLFFEGIDYIDHIQLYYFSKNTLFARVYDLIAKTEFEMAEQEELGENLEIGVNFKGKLKVNDAKFINIGRSTYADELADRLNSMNLIRDRLLELELLDFRIKYDSGENKWTVMAGTGRGSTVWTILPPVLMKVNFSENVAIKTLELFQLVAFEINRLKIKK